MAALVVLRKERGLRQADIAQRVHVGQQEISRWEAGQALTLAGLLAYADALGARVEFGLVPRED